LFGKYVDGRATIFEVFNIIGPFLEENEMKWENCSRPALTDPSQCLDEMQDFRLW